MLDTIKNIQGTSTKKSSNAIWSDDLISTYYSNYFVNLNSKQLDKEFNSDILMLVKALSKLPDNDRKALIEALARVIEFYIENKVEKEVELSFNKFLKF
jgi:hypothetical protein